MVMLSPPQVSNASSNTVSSQGLVLCFHPFDVLTLTLGLSFALPFREAFLTFSYHFPVLLSILFCCYLLLKLVSLREKGKALQISLLLLFTRAQSLEGTIFLCLPVWLPQHACPPPSTALGLAHVPAPTSDTGLFSIFFYRFQQVFTSKGDSVILSFHNRSRLVPQ